MKNRAVFCVQACVASFLCDKCIPKTVLQLICEQPSLCGVGTRDEGIIDEKNLQSFFGSFSLTIERLPEDYVLKELDQDGSVFIGLKWKECGEDIRHMVRFDKFGNDERTKLGVMDPNDQKNELTWRDSSYFEGKTVIHYRVRLTQRT